ncbi:MAG: PAS domain S-box protein [Methanoregulaceae archaeon]
MPCLDEALQESERKFREIFNWINDAIHLHEIGKDGRPGKFIDVNDVACRMLQYSREEMLEHAPLDFTTEYHSRPIEKIFEELNSVGHALFETEHKRKDGTIVPVEVNAHVITLQGKKVVLSVIRDMTERKKTTEYLQYAHQQLSDIIEFLPDATLVIDKKGVIIAWNKAIEVMTGIKKAQMIGKGNYEYSVPFYGTRRPILIDLVFSTKEVIEKNYSGVKAEGSTIYAETFVPGAYQGTGAYLSGTASPLFDAKGNLYGAIESIRDITEQKRADEALRESQIRLISILQGSPIPKFVIDKNHHVIYWNKALEKFSGVTSDIVIGTNQHWKAFYKKERPTMADLLVDNAIEKIPEYYEGKFTKSKVVDEAYESTDFFPHLGKSGSWLFYTTAPIKDPKGNIIGAVETLEDISDRKRAEEEIRTLSRFQESIISNANVWLMVLDKKGMILIWNNAAAKISGYHASEVLGTNNIWKFLYPDPDYRKKITRTLTRIISERKYLENFETSIISKSSEKKEILWNTRSLETEDEKPLRFVAIGVDITKSVQTELALRESQERYRAVVEDQTEFICRFTPDGKLTFVNDAYCRYFNLDKTRCIDNNHSVILPPEDARKMKQHLASLTLQNQVAVIEHRIIMSSGEVRWQRWNDRAIFDKDGRVVEYQSVGRDTTEQKRAEESLKQSEEKYREFFTTSRDCVFITSPVGHWIEFNDAALELFGYGSREELQRVPISSLYEYPEERAEFLKKIVEDGYVKEFPVRLQKKDNIILDTLITAVPLREADGSIKAFVGTIRDITEQKRAEESLRQSEEKFRNVLENVPDLILVHRKGLVVYVNPAMVHTMGYSANEVLNKPLTDYIVPKYRERVAEMIRNRSGGASIEPYEIELQSRTGEHRMVIVRGTMIEFSGLPAVLNVLTDITERKHAEAILHETEERYRSLFDRSLDCVYIHDFEGKFIDANPSALKLLGYTKDEITSISFFSLLTPIQIQLARDVIQEVIATGTQQEPSEYHIRCKNGNYIDVETTATLLYRQGKVYAIQGFAHDITERKKSEERLKKFNEELEKGIAERTSRLNASLEEKVVLLREVHHRVKNNLQIIISLVNLQMRQIDDARLKQVMAETQNRIRAMSLVHEKLYQSDSLSQIDLSDYIRFLATQLFAFYGMDSRQVIPNIDIRKTMVDINTAIPLGLMINELTSNSLKYAFPGGRKGEIIMSVQKQNHTISIVFKDNGIGIRGDLDWRNTESLGLRLVISLVEQLSGTIELDRQGGTTFTIVVKEKE